MNRHEAHLHNALLKTLAILFFILFVVLTALNIMNYLDGYIEILKNEGIQFYALLFLVSIPWIRVLFKSALLFIRNQKKLSGMCLLSLAIIWTAIYLSTLD